MTQAPRLFNEVETRQPSVSVVMSVYNGERYLEAAMDSILAQTLADFELIVIDDGSTDGSSAMLDRYVAADPRVRLVRRENRGLTASLNEGIALASGAYLARMDADDVALPDRLSRQVAALEADGSLVAVGTAIEKIDHASRPLGPVKMPTDHAAIEAALWEGNGGVLSHPALMLRTEALRQVGGYNPAYKTAQDLDLYLRLAELGRLANLPETLLLYRVHAASVNYAKLDQQERDVLAMLREAAARRGVAFTGRMKRARWQNRVRAVVRSARAGRYREGCYHAWRGWRLRPTALRSWALLAAALLGPRAVARLLRISAEPDPRAEG